MRKRIIVFLVFLASALCKAQGNSFVLLDNKMIWENVFMSNETNIPQLIGRHIRLKLTSSEGNTYKGTGSMIKNTCTGTSDYMKGYLNFDFEIKAGDGKYSVTVTNMAYTPVKNKPAVSLENYLIKKGALAENNKTEADLSCLDAYFNRIFGITTVYQNKF
jgi:hypothetical protein